MKLVGLVQRSVLPLGILTAYFVLVPAFITLVSIVNPNLLYPSVEQLQPWQYWSVIIVGGIYTPIIIYVMFWSKA